MKNIFYAVLLLCCAGTLKSSFQERIFQEKDHCVVVKIIQGDFEDESMSEKLKSFFAAYSLDESSKSFLNNDFESYKEKFSIDASYYDQDKYIKSCHGLYGFFLKPSYVLVGLCDLEKGCDDNMEIVRMVHPSYRKSKEVKKNISFGIGSFMYLVACKMLFLSENRKSVIESYIDSENHVSLHGMKKYGEPLGFMYEKDVEIQTQYPVTYKKFICTYESILEKKSVLCVNNYFF